MGRTYFILFFSLDVHSFPKRFWVSDEYGPYIYHYSKDGDLISIIQPPEAILPRDTAGNLNFTGTTNQATGRAGNQGTNFLTILPKAILIHSLL